MRAGPGDAGEPAQRPPEKARRTHLLVLVVGAISILLLLGTDRLRQRVVTHDSLLEASMAEVKTQITLAHLWVEERVSGDEVSDEEIDSALAGAVERLDDMLGEGVSDGVLEGARLADPRHRELGRDLRERLADFRSFAILRRRSYDEGLPVGIGSFADQAFDRNFRVVFDLAESLRVELSRRRIDNERRSRAAFYSLLAVWSLIVGAAAVAIRSRERQRVEALGALFASQEQLFQSQKMEAVGRLAGGLAHDINNYLAAIRGHCELVQLTNPSGDKLTRRMDAAIHVVDKASAMISRLLTLSHRQPLTVASVRLNDLARDLERVFGPTLGEGIELELRLAESLWPVEADPSQLEQVLANLVVNAKDAMPGGGKVQITTSNRPSTGNSPQLRDEVWLEVEDTGDGIAPELLPRVFEPFLTTKGGKSHAGLGLAVVYGIVRQSEGKIEVTSTVGQGTRFRIRLPRFVAPSGAPTASAETVIPRSSPVS